MKNVLYKGRPADCSGRLQKEIKIYDILDSLDVKYDRVDHDHADTIADCDNIAAVLNAKICKNLVLCNAQKTDFYLLLMPGEKPFKTKLLSPQLGCSRLSFAPPEYMERYLNCTPGSASVLGLLFDTECAVRLIIDKDLLDNELIGCHPCINTTSLSIHTDDLIGKIIPYSKHTPTFVEL